MNGYICAEKSVNLNGLEYGCEGEVHSGFEDCV